MCETLKCISGSVLKISFFLYSVFILLNGIVILIVGVAILDGAITLDLGDSKELKKASDSAGVSDLNTQKLDTSAMMGPIGKFVLTLGLYMTAMGAFGMLPVFKPLLWKPYIVVSGISFFLAFILAILIYSTTMLDDAAKPYAQESLEDYRGVEGTDSTTLVWNLIMNHFSCCGVDDYKDFKKLKNWPPSSYDNLEFNQQETPVMCCKNKFEAPHCAEQAFANNSNNNINSGCFNKVMNLVKDHPGILATVGFALFYLGIGFVGALLIVIIEPEED